MSTPLRIGIAGLGTVGIGTLKLLEKNRKIIASRTGGLELQVVAISARDKKKDRGVDLSAYHWHDDPVALANDPDVEVVVELMGGSEGAAYDVCMAALENGKPLVTANKALIAHHGMALAAKASEIGLPLAFEAAVAGGIPVIHALRTGLAANRIERIEGILNGTCNYILTRMRDEGKDFSEVLADAQKLGYAEADPSFDVDGVDAAHKLAILTSLAYGCALDFESVNIEGIRSITASDIAFAREFGYVIRLLGIATRTAQGTQQRVHPCLVPLSAPVAKVDGVFNAVVVQGDAVGTVMFEGRGAGAGPTASSVVSDLMDIARGGGMHPFTIPVEAMQDVPAVPLDELESSFYIRLEVVDKPGVLADVTSIFRDHAISMRAFVQHSRQPGAKVELAILTHAAREKSMREALEKISALQTVLSAPQRIRIEGETNE